MCTQFLHLHINVLHQPRLCAEQEAHARHSLVDLGVDDAANGLGWYYADVWSARKRLDSAHGYRNIVWRRKYMVRPAINAKDLAGDDTNPNCTHYYHETGSGTTSDSRPALKQGKTWTFGAYAFAPS